MSADEPPSPPRRAPSLRRLAASLASTLVTLLVVEIGYRISAGIPVFSLRDWRDERIISETINQVSEFDPVLGWRLRPNISYEQQYTDGIGLLSTTEHGLRNNGPGMVPMTGGILLVGDSYGAGSEVRDEQTPSAHLERMLGQPVLNGSAGGWGTDQIVLRTEALMPLLEPTTVLLAFNPSSIERAGYSHNPYPKPFYTIEDSQLVFHGPSAVPSSRMSNRALDGLKGLAGRSAVINALMARYATASWLAGPGEVYEQVGNDEVAVTCQLLDRLKEEVDDRQARLLLFLIHSGTDLAASDQPSAPSRLVNACATEAGIQVVDGFPSLRAIYSADPADFRTYFVMHDETYGHMSSRGNEHVARLIADAIQASQPATSNALAPTRQSFAPGDGRNLIPGSEALDQWLSPGTIVSIEPAQSEQNPNEFRLRAAGADGEHYATGAVSDPGPGYRTLSFEVRPDGMPTMRAQLLDRAQNGIIAEIRFSDAAAIRRRVGETVHIGGEVEELGRGWYRVWIGADMPAGDKIVILQPSDAQGNFS